MQIPEEHRNRHQLIQQRRDQNAFDGAKPQRRHRDHDRPGKLRAHDEDGGVADVLQRGGNLHHQAGGQGDEHQEAQQDGQRRQRVGPKQRLQDLGIEHQNDERNPAGNKVVDQDVERDLATTLRVARHEVERAHTDAKGGDVGGGRDEQESFFEDAVLGLRHQADQEYGQSDVHHCGQELRRRQPERLDSKPRRLLGGGGPRHSADLVLQDNRSGSFVR